MAVSFFGDDGYYTVRSWWIAQYLSGNKLNSLFMSGAFHPYAWSGYLVLMALFYCFFGFSPISVTFLNCIFSVSSGVIFYLIAKEVTSDSRIARLVTILCVFFPSLFLWSIVNLKDSAYIFLTIVILWSFLKVVKNKGMMYFIFLILALGLQYSIRSNIFILCSTIVILVFNYLIIKNKQKYMILIFLIFLYILFSFKVDPYVLEMKNKLISYHKGVVSTGGFVYHLYDNWVYRPEINSSQVGYFALFKASIRGWIHYFLEPFPWKIYTWLNLMALPQMMLWYFLLPFAMMGFFMQLCCNWRYSILLISYLLVIGSILSLTGGNIGTDFRIRDLLTPIILFFSAVGLSRVFINNIRE